MTRSTGKVIEVAILVLMMLSVAGAFNWSGYGDEFMGTPGTIALCLSGFVWHGWVKCYPLGKT